MKILNIIIPERMIGERLDSALSEMLPDYSRSKISAWIKAGDALINKKTFKPKDKATGTEIVCLALNHKQSHDWNSARRITAALSEIFRNNSTSFCAGFSNTYSLDLQTVAGNS